MRRQRGKWQANEKQVAKVFAIAHERGIHDSDSVLYALRELTGRHLESPDDLTGDEVDLVAKDRGEALFAAWFRSMGMHVERAERITDDPWGGKPDGAVEVVYDAGEAMTTPSIANAATKPQLAKLGAMFGEIGITDKDERRDFCIAVINRPIASAADMTKKEASAVIDHITRTNGAHA